MITATQAIMVRLIDQAQRTLQFYRSQLTKEDIQWCDIAILVNNAELLEHNIVAYRRLYWLEESNPQGDQHLHRGMQVNDLVYKFTQRRIFDVPQAD